MEGLSVRSGMILLILLIMYSMLLLDESFVEDHDS